MSSPRRNRPAYGTHCSWCTSDDARIFAADGSPICLRCATTVRDALGTEEES